MADDSHSSGTAMLPAIGAILLTLIWGAYTVVVAFEIFTSPLPHA